MLQDWEQSVGKTKDSHETENINALHLLCDDVGDDDRLRIRYSHSSKSWLYQCFYQRMALRMEHCFSGWIRCLVGAVADF